MKIKRASLESEPYLQRLSSIVKPPKLLSVLGQLPTNSIKSVAIVGTRKPTRYGREVTEMIASGLARNGIVVVSGLALGVDAIAHRAAVEAGGRTVAVLANGLPDIYPSTNKHLADEILLKNGAIVSEYPDHERAKSWTFLERNRIVSGLSDAVVITEAASGSGTLNTANHALEQGRDVWVVPGNITSPMSTGCNKLISHGANPLTNVDDLIDSLLPNRETEQKSLPLGSTELETQVIHTIAEGVSDGDELQQKIGCSATDLSTALTMLELNGVLKNLGANQWILR